MTYSSTSPNLGLRLWSGDADQFDNADLTFNWNAIDTVLAATTTMATLTLTSNTTTALQLNGLASGITLGADTRISRASARQFSTNAGFTVARAATGDVVLQAQIDTDTTGMRISVITSGLVSWGPGGSSSADTNLYRYSAGNLKTDGTLLVGTGATGDTTTAATSQTIVGIGSISVVRSAAGNSTFLSYTAGDTQPRWSVDSGGTVKWGPGSVTTPDTNLYRQAAGVLRMDGASGVGATLDLSNATAAMIRFGASQDTNLYRNAADRLKTDDLVDATGLGLASKVKAGTPVDGDWAAPPPDGTIVVDSTASKIWVRMGGVWKGVTVA